ncbi:MAG TPA: class II fructose-bisphosphate aldolase, partial [Methylophilaceae bacterium]
KVNIDTDLRMAFTGAVRKFIMQPDNRRELDPRKFLLVATKAMKEICKARYEAFGSAGHASSIKAISCDRMAERYKNGELVAIVN